MTQRTPTQLLGAYLRPQTKQVALLAVLVLLGITIQLVNPQIIRRFLDGVQDEMPLVQLRNLALLFIIFSVVHHAIKLAAVYVGEVVAWTATNALRTDLALHCLRLDMAFHKVHKPGELIERVDGDINLLATFFSQLIIKLTANGILTIGVLTLLWLTNAWIAAAVILLTLSGVFIIRALNKIAIPRVEALRDVEARLFGYIEEWLTGTETIRSNAAAPYIMRRLYALLRERWQRGHHSFKVTTALSATVSSIFSLTYISVFTLGAWQFLDQRISLGALYVTFYYIDMLRDPFWQLKRQVEELQRAAASINRINNLFAEQPSIVDIDTNTDTDIDTDIDITHGVTVTVDHLSFAYADEPDELILDDIHFTLEAGKVLGLLGRTGSGKSTLTKLIIRFYDPTHGAILLGDGEKAADIRTIPQATLRHKIGMVTQQVQLFSGTLRDNLTLFDRSIDDAKIITALHEVGLDGWLDGLDDGLDSLLSAEHSLSAGEAQLLAFSRVFLADAKLIILDEASSRLDLATEQRIEHALDKLLQNRTVIIVAHRLATVNRADDIMVLGNGRILEHDTRTTLLADPSSHFAQLIRTGEVAT